MNVIVSSIIVVLAELRSATAPCIPAVAHVMFGYVTVGKLSVPFTITF